MAEATTMQVAPKAARGGTVLAEHRMQPVGGTEQGHRRKNSGAEAEHSGHPQQRQPHSQCHNGVGAQPYAYEKQKKKGV